MTLRRKHAIILLSRPALRHLAAKECLTLQVEDAAMEFERINKAGVPIAYPLRDEPWGQRRFGLTDHAGMCVDVVQQIEPEPGFWDEYVE